MITHIDGPITQKRPIVIAASEGSVVILATNLPYCLVLGNKRGVVVKLSRGSPKPSGQYYFRVFRSKLEQQKCSAFRPKIFVAKLWVSRESGGIVARITTDTPRWRRFLSGRCSRIILLFKPIIIEILNVIILLLHQYCYRPTSIRQEVCIGVSPTSPS